MPVYNAERYVSQAINSVLEQTFGDWEMMVVDDGSTDRSAEIVSEFVRADPRIHLFRQENRRQAAARNAGIRQAQGEWIAFLDADDWWLPEKLALQATLIAAQPNVDVFYSNGHTYFEETRQQEPYHYPMTSGFKTGREFFTLQFFANYIPILSVAVRRDWIVKVGLQDEAAEIAGVEDYDYWLRMMKAEAAFFGAPQKLFVYRVHRASFSADEQRQLYRGALVRIKNFDPLLLRKPDHRRFWEQMHGLAQSLATAGHPEWAADIRRRVGRLTLRVSFLGKSHYITRQLRAALLARPKKKVKNVLWRLLTRVYFPLRKRLSRPARRLNLQYTDWMLAPHLVNQNSLKLDPTAKISMGFMSNRINAIWLIIGDCTRINMIKENAELIAGDNVVIARFCNFNILGRVVLGNNVVFNNYCSVNCFDEVMVGDNSWFGEGVRFYDHNHKYKDADVPFTAQGYTTGRIIVGANVWVGANTVILKNVSIGDGCVIGANNLIYKSLPPNTMVKARAMEIVEPIARVKSNN